MTTIRKIYENTKAKGEKYLDCPVLLCLPPNTTIEPDAYYEIDCSKVGSQDNVGDNYVLIMLDLE